MITEEQCHIQICKEQASGVPLILVVETQRRTIVRPTRYCLEHIDWQANNFPAHFIFMIGETDAQHQLPSAVRRTR